MVHREYRPFYGALRRFPTFPPRVYEAPLKIPTILGTCIHTPTCVDWYYTKREEVHTMDLRDLLEQAVDAGVFTTMSLPVSDVQDADRVADFDWDAYPHMAELA